ncbi:phage tail sheath subtilisin-like domain-containing protein [Luteibacter aegosomatis]|uniref:phage tail sheath subtilisin-like domain-containing protein n=1 Tax=Luteibacter aegosomatis TaxID=2911537 RepID=UPI001FFABEF1|nr:phage tail sheath subtilisin-like domain-containing protein [Luteibacter aegosomatis]UPG87028.1 phage tail sheath subtilisin-like domain-containing protein [Luteibacter aegosomatis]
MNIALNTIPASTRKPGTYFEFNTSLAVNTLPSNAQSLLLVVPLLDAGTMPPLVATVVYDAPSAFALTGSTVAQAMVAAAIKANRYLQISLVGIKVVGDAEPDITPALDATATGDYTQVVSAWQSTIALTAMRTHIEEVTNSINQKSLLGVAAVVGTLTAATTLASALNSAPITLALLPGTAYTAAELAAAYAAVIASESDPARPLNTLALTGVPVPAIANRLSRNEQETALLNGVTPLEVGPGEVVQIVRAISTYTKSEAGTADVSMLDITTMRTLYYVRQACRERVALRFPRSKNTARIAASVRGELLDVLKKCEALEVVENVDANADGLVVEKSATDANWLVASIPADVVNGLHVFAGVINLIL